MSVYKAAAADFVTKVLVICFVAVSFKIAQLNCNVYFITVDYQHTHRSSNQVRLEGACFKRE